MSAPKETPEGADRLTRKQAAVIGAYTGYICGPFSDVHAYVDGLPGFKGITSGFSFVAMAGAIHEAAKADFLALCAADDPDATQVISPPLLLDGLEGL